jgi:Ser/Thr protein kinase RdoA (MazF antagonist)
VMSGERYAVGGQTINVEGGMVPLTPGRGPRSPVFFQTSDRQSSGNLACAQDPDPVSVLKAFGLTNITATALVRQGVTKTIWRVHTPGKVFALHVFHPDQDVSFRDELWAMEFAGHAGIPVPAIHAQGMWQDRPVMIATWCAGEPLLSTLRTHPWTIRAIGCTFGALHARIHRLHVPQHEKETEEWIEWLAPVPAPIKDRLRALSLRSDSLLHFDYHLENVMANHNRVTAVLDWQKVCAGDPRADIAQSVIGILFSPDKSSPPLLHSAARSLLARWYLHGYQRVSGPLYDMAPFYVWAGIVQATIYGNLKHETDRSAADLERRYLIPLRRWTDRWSRHADGDEGR